MIIIKAFKTIHFNFKINRISCKIVGLKILNKIIIYNLVKVREQQIQIQKLIHNQASIKVFKTSNLVITLILNLELLKLVVIKIIFLNKI